MADLNRVREDRFAAEKLRAQLLKRARSAQATAIARRNMSINKSIFEVILFRKSIFVEYSMSSDRVLARAHRRRAPRE